MPAAQARLSGDAAQHRGQPAGVAGAGRRALPVHRAGKVMSHKLITHFDASIPACPEHRGPSTLRGGAEGAPAACRRTTGVWRALLRQSIDSRALINPRFMAVYADLFYTKSLFSLELR